MGDFLFLFNIFLYFMSVFFQYWALITITKNLNESINIFYNVSRYSVFYEYNISVYNFLSQSWKIH